MTGENDDQTRGIDIVRKSLTTLVRQIAAMGGDVGPFVPRAVAERLAARFAAS